jgi:hypothetical protein
MDFRRGVALLEAHGRAIEALTKGLTAEQARRKPDAESWSVLEVINHLYDEEREDFRQRLDILLNRPNDPIPPIHPGAWVTERGYNARDFEKSVASFMGERRKSLEWLGTLKEPNLDSGTVAPDGRVFHAGEMFASWVAHDVLHLRQLAELHYMLVKEAMSPFDVSYAGDW